MRRIFTYSALLLAMPILHGCDSKGGGVIGSKDEKVTQVKMDDIDSIEGTISDEMINTDTSTDEAPVDTSAASTDAKPKSKSVKVTDAKDTATKDKPVIETADKPAEAPAAGAE